MAVDNSSPTPVSGTQDYTLVVDQVALTITAGDANIVMDLCLVPSKTPLQKEAEVVVDKFEYLP